MSLQSKLPDLPRRYSGLTMASNAQNTALLTASAAFSVLAFVAASYSFLDTNGMWMSPTRIICCLGFFPASTLMTRAVKSSWKSRATFCLAVSSVNALISTIIMTHSDPMLGHVYLSLSTVGTICYYKAYSNDNDLDFEESLTSLESPESPECLKLETSEDYQASALVFCYLACVVPLWTQMERANLIQIVLNCGIMYFLTVRPTAVSRFLALLVTILSSFYLMCTTQGPAGGVHLVFMAFAAELTIDYSKYSRLGEKKATHDTLAFLCFICGLATLGVALSASQPTEFLTVYLAVFLSLLVNAMSANSYRDKLVHMIHTILWSWLVSVYMMHNSYHHGIIHAMLSVTTICIYSEMDLSEQEDDQARETPLRYIASTVCIIAGLVTIDIWVKHVIELGAEEDNVIILSIMAGLFQMLICFGSLCILDENHDGKIGQQDALRLFVGVASVQIGVGLAQMYFISYYKGLLVLVLCLGSMGLCWAEYVKTSPSLDEHIGTEECKKSMV